VFLPAQFLSRTLSFARRKRANFISLPCEIFKQDFKR
jgi:hypothetical protein